MWQTESYCYRIFLLFFLPWALPLRPMWMELICVIYANKSFSAQYENTASFTDAASFVLLRYIRLAIHRKKKYPKAWRKWVKRAAVCLEPCSDTQQQRPLFRGTATNAKLIKKVHTLFLFLEKCSFSYFPLTGFSRVAFIPTRLKFSKKKKKEEEGWKLNGVK